MPDSNNTPSVGCSYESNAIYLEEIRSELTEIQWKCGYFPDLEIENNRDTHSTKEMSQEGESEKNGKRWI